MRVSIRSLLGMLFVLALILSSFAQVPALADSNIGPSPPAPVDSIPPVDSTSEPDNTEETTGLVQWIILIILPLL